MRRWQPLEKANMNILPNLLLLSLRFVLLLIFILHIFIFVHITLSISLGFTSIDLSSRGRDIPFDFFFLDQTTPALKSLVCPLNDSDVATSCSIVSHFLRLDLLSPSSNQKDAFHVALAMLESISQMCKAKAFISNALAQTSYIFSSIDCAVKSNAEIVSKLDALKEKKVEFDHSLLAKKQATQRLSELGIEYLEHPKLYLSSFMTCLGYN